MDYLAEAKEAYVDARESVSEQYKRIREDFQFSNPSMPRQWSQAAIDSRRGRPQHTLDRTNKYIQHVVNKMREAKTSADILPVDSGADPRVAEKIKGIFRHIEYVSKADQAWDMASDHQVRGGLGWVRIVPKIVDPETNEQEILFQRVIDPLSACLNAGWQEPDGSDATDAFIDSTMPISAFKKRWPRAKLVSWEVESRVLDEKQIGICEHMKVEEEKIKKVAILGPDGGKLVLTEKEYDLLVEQTGVQFQILNKFTTKKRSVKWYIYSGDDVLEETEFPSQFVGLIPVVGHELWLEGKRYLCGLVRRLMDGQRLHNFEMSALTEALMAQPKAPFLVPGRALEGYEDAWNMLNSGNPSHLPYNDYDPDTGQPISPPIRLSPPNFPVAYANASNIAVQEMEEAVGMPRSTFGQQSNAVSGRAKIADQTAGEMATFHFMDNRRVAQTQAYRVVLDMLPRVYDSVRQARILGEDGNQGSVQIDPNLPGALRARGGKIMAINPGVGRYDVRVKVGPSYTTIREELGTKLQELGKGNPVLAATLTPMLMKLSDMPEADKITRVVMAMLPPEVQKAYEETDDSDIPPQAKAQIDQQGQQIQKMAAAMEQAHAVIKDLQEQLNQKSEVVKSEAKVAMTEIKVAKQELENQAKDIKTQESLFEKNKRIAKLEFELEVAKAADQLSAKNEELSKKNEEVETKQEERVDEALLAVAKAIEEGQKTVAEALSKNIQTVAELQSITVEAVEDMADAISAPRKIQLQKGKDGRTVGATSIAVMSEPGAAKTDASEPADD
jgi:Phage P22-like portal protein